MTITLEQAKQAGEIAAQIAVISSLREQAQTAKDQSWLISHLSALDANGQQHALITVTLDATTSANALDYCIGVYDAMLTGLNAQLAAL